MGDVVDMASRRPAPEPVGAGSGYRVVVYAPDGSSAVDYTQGVSSVLAPSADEADDVARALLEVVDLLEPREWR